MAQVSLLKYLKLLLNQSVLCLLQKDLYHIMYHSPALQLPIKELLEVINSMIAGTKMRGTMKSTHLVRRLLLVITLSFTVRRLLQDISNLSIQDLNGPLLMIRKRLFY